MNDGSAKHVKYDRRGVIQVRLLGTLLAVLAWNRQQKRGLPKWLEDEISSTLKYAEENDEVES